MSHPTIAIKLNRAGELAVKKGHPWVFEKSIEKGPIEKKPAGSLCVLFDQRTNKPFAFGLWDPNEIIRIKIISRENRLTLNKDFWENQLLKAQEKRKNLLKITNGYRVIHGENDYFPGLILDVYDTTGVLKIYSQIWKPFLGTLIPLIQELFSLDRIVFRMSRKMAEKNIFPFQEGEIIGKPLDDERIVFRENEVLFYAYPVSGHKTGFFLDQRPNRIWVGEHAANQSVLDVFSYVGSFGIHALKGGASSLTSIDISAQAMDVARENLNLNGLDESKWNPMIGDAFELLQKLHSEGKTFDLVIIDPPTFTTRESHISSALNQYERLAELGAALTHQSGYLILGSCSSRIGLDDFNSAHQNAFDRQARIFKPVKTVLHDADHPIGYEEGLYLKTIIYQRER